MPNCGQLGRFNARSGSNCASGAKYLCLAGNRGYLIAVTFAKIRSVLRKYLQKAVALKAHQP
jgi:hypothetical protein